MKLQKFKKIIAGIMLIALVASFVSGCAEKKDKTTASPSPSVVNDEDSENSENTENDSASSSDAPQNLDYVAMMGDVPVYESQYYYFLFTALSEAYYSSEEFEALSSGYYDDKDEDEKLKDFVDFYYKKPEGSDKTNLQLAAERALEICHTFNISGVLGKENNLLTQEEIDGIIEDVDNIADQYSSYYSMTRDECMKSMYGMNVNDLKNYTVLQSYVNAHMKLWKSENGYLFEEEEPQKPEKPTDPGDDATDDERETYETELKKYDEELADYNDALKEYNEKEEVFWEQFREAYNKGVDAYKIVSVRYLYISTLDENGEALDEEAKKAKREEIDSCVKLVSEQGYDFEKVIKGFSDSDEGICDLDIANASETPFTEEIILWASETAKISDEIKVFETDDGYYAVQIVGVTDFDKTEGVVADAQEVASPENIRETVSYYYLNDLYNQYVTLLTEADEYQLSEINYDRMYELAEEYVNDTGAEESSDE